MLLGEELKRPFTYRSVLINDDGIRAKQAHKKELLRQFIMAEIQKVIMPLLPNPEEDPEGYQQKFQDLIPPEQLEQHMSTEYMEAREHLANQILQYLMRKESIIEKKNDAFKHGLISGEEFVWVGVRNGEPTIDVLNPLGVFYHKSPEVKYVEDGLYAGYRTMMNTGDILDRFGEYMDDKDIERLEGTLQGVNGIRDDIIDKKMKYHHTDVYDQYLSNYLSRSHEEGSYGQSRGEDWLVTHVEWRSQKKVGFITFTNDFGEQETDIVDENFPVPDYAVRTRTPDKYGKSKTIYSFDGYTLEWGWIPEIWQGVRIGDDIYCCIGPKEYQYRSLDNPKRVKLGYHGVIYNNMNADSVSLMDRMKPFQYLYFIVVHKLKKLIARDRGKVFSFDVTMVPEELGLEKTLYYLEEMDIDFYNPLQNAEQPGIHQRSKITSAIDRSNMQHILNYIQLMDALDFQISDVAGITRVREGQTSSQEAVTNAQQNLLQSSTITEAVYFFPHEKLWENVLNSLVQCAQTCWKNKSVIRQYALDDLSVQTLNVTPSSLENADFSVFISNVASDSELFNNLKSLAQPLIQNDKARFTDIIKLFKATSPKELEKHIESSERRTQQEQMEQIRAQQEAQQQAIQAQQQSELQKQQHEKELQAQKDEAAYARELLKVQANSNQAPESIDPIEVSKLQHEIEMDRAQLEIDRRKLELDKKKLEIDKNKIEAQSKDKEKDRQSREKIAKMRPKPTSSSSKSK